MRVRACILLNNNCLYAHLQSCRRGRPIYIYPTSNLNTGGNIFSVYPPSRLRLTAHQLPCSCSSSSSLSYIYLLCRSSRRRKRSTFITSCHPPRTKQDFLLSFQAKKIATKQRVQQYRSFTFATSIVFNSNASNIISFRGEQKLLMLCMGRAYLFCQKLCSRGLLQFVVANEAVRAGIY